MSCGLNVLDVEFDDNGFWSNPTPRLACPGPDSLALFDQNGYDLCPLEIEYAHANDGWQSQHRNSNHIALRKQWFRQPAHVLGPVLNHALIFERKGYADRARDQLVNWAKFNPLIHKMIRYRPKWGFDFSIDYVGEDGEVFEALHYEFDSFDLNEVKQQRQWLEPIFLNTDWQHFAASLIKHKDEWHSLGFTEQSAWKCKHLGITPERYLLVAWE